MPPSEEEKPDGAPPDLGGAGLDVLGWKPGLPFSAFTSAITASSMRITQDG